MPEWALAAELALIPVAAAILRLWSDVRALRAISERREQAAAQSARELAELAKDMSAVRAYLANRPNGARL